MIICPACQTSYPEQTTFCPKDGIPLSADATDEGVSTLEEGLSADELLREGLPQDSLLKTLPPEEPPNKLSQPSGKLSQASIKVPQTNAKVSSLEEQSPSEVGAVPTRKKSGPVVIVKTSDGDSDELIKAETVFAKEKDPQIAALASSFPEIPNFAEKTNKEAPQEQEDGGVSTLEEPIAPFDRYIGTVITNYKVERKLGQGGMGAVYLASHFTLGRQVAIKILNQQFVAKHDVVRRFFDEARASNKIKHPHIIEVFDVGVLPDRSAYLIMEFLEGSDLKSVLKKRGALPVNEIQSLFVPICEALQAAHDSGIVHRDLKPENIFICNDQGKDFPKIVDFGIAKLSDNNLDIQLRTRTGMVMGTPAYMSPEQASGQKQLDARADIYSLGVILYECLTGHPPFRGESVAAILIKQVTEMPEEMRNIVPEKHIPPKLNDLVQSCLQKDPKDRPQSMQEILHELKKPETFMPSGTVEAVSRPEVVPPKPVLPLPEIKKESNATKITRLKDLGKDEPPKNKTALWAIAGVIFSVVVFLGVWSVVNKKPNLPKENKPAASQELEIPTLQFSLPKAKGLIRNGQELSTH
jgi:serine/threonine protein kinase